MNICPEFLHVVATRVSKHNGLAKIKECLASYAMENNITLSNFNSDSMMNKADYVSSNLKGFDFKEQFELIIYFIDKLGGLGSSSMKDLKDSLYDEYKEDYDFFYGDEFSRKIDLLSNLSTDFHSEDLRTSTSIKSIVRELINNFKHIVENGLYKEIHDQRETQIGTWFSTASRLSCKDNDIDLSPEPLSGGGKLDFKFSKGHSEKVIVELKLSSGNVLHGYEVQIQRYIKAEEAKDAFYVIIEQGNESSDDIENITNDLEKIKQDLSDKKEVIPEIIFIDARNKKPPSKP